MFDFKKNKKLIITSKDDCQNDFKSNELKNAEEHFFYHDIINHTHGILLYLNQKEVIGEGLQNQEIKGLSKEIKNLQSLISDHYKLLHKNIHTIKRTINSDEVKECLNNLVNIYLKNKNVELQISLNSSTAVFYQSSLQRILTNLIKNMNEIDSKNFNIQLTIDDQGLNLVTTNELPGVESKDIPEYMRRLILNESVSNRECVGLDSVFSISQELRGNFNFSIYQGKWVNELFLPSVLDETNTKQAS